MKPIKHPTIDTGWLERYLIQLGHSRKQLLKGAGFSKGTSAEILKKMPYNHYLKLLAWAEQQTQDNYLGFTLGNLVGPDDFGPAAFMAIQAPTVRDFLCILQQYQSLISTGIEFTINEKALESSLSYKLIGPNRPGSNIDIDMTLVMMINVLRQSYDDNWIPNKVNLSYPKPDDPSLIYEVYGENIAFDQPVSCLYFDTAILDSYLNTGDPQLFEILQNELRGLIEQSNHNDDFLLRVRTALTSMIGSKHCNSSTLANQLNISQRTLVRNLTKLDTSYSELKAEIIEELSKVALKESHISLFEIAIRMGFSETSAFNRMFKAKTGISPGVYRERFKEHLI